MTSNLRETVDRLADWYEKNRRALPWRRSSDPYRIWLSEIMLQQTQVATVIPYYEKFLLQFPTLNDLAKASEETVFSLWAGLGYYSRARNLLRGAQYVVRVHGGVFPRAPRDLAKVPGIGRYTAGAIASIAFNERAAIVDGNVERVFSRFYRIDTELKARVTQNQLWNLADSWVATCENPRVLNQALMELGATLCSRSNPRCERCPLAPQCKGRKSGNPAQFPVRKPRQAKIEIHWMSLVALCEGQIFLHRKRKGEWWAGLWDVPHLALTQVGDAEGHLEELVHTLPIASFETLGMQRHTVTHHALRSHAWALRLKTHVDSIAGFEGRWHSLESLSELPKSGLVQKILSSLENASRLGN